MRRANEDLALLLLERGADPGVRDDAGQTPLHAASHMGGLKPAQQLLELGADINSHDNQGRTPLHVIQWDDDDVAQLLLELGADPDVRDNHGHTPLDVATREGNLKVRQLLLKFKAEKLLPGHGENRS